MDTQLRIPRLGTTDTEPGACADGVERFRGRLFGVAYRMLGDPDEAHDVVQEAFLRWHQGDRADVAAPEGWLVAVVTRLAIDRLRRLAVERAAYTGPWLPTPVATEGWSADRDAELASDLSMALLVLLERLAPEERAAFLLRELFDADYAEIARVLDRSEPAVRQMVHRARERVRAGRPRVAVPPGEHERLLDRFLAAVGAADQEALLALVAPDATFTSDGGGKVPAARRVVADRARIVRLLVGLERKWGHRVRHEPGVANGGPAVLTWAGDQLVCVTLLETDGARITAFYRVLNPDKLHWVGKGGGGR